MIQKVSNVSSVSKKILLALVLFQTSFCTLIKQEEQTQTQAPQTPVSTQTVQMTLFYPKSDGSGLIRGTAKVEDVQKNSKLWFEEMVKQLSVEKNEAFEVFSENPQVYSVFFDKDALIVDFSSNIQKTSHATIAKAQLALDALLNSIKTNFPQVQSVKILAEHEDIEVIFGHIYAMQPFQL